MSLPSNMYTRLDLSKAPTINRLAQAIKDAIADSPGTDVLVRVTAVELVQCARELHALQGSAIDAIHLGHVLIELTAASGAKQAGLVIFNPGDWDLGATPFARECSVREECVTNRKLLRATRGCCDKDEETAAVESRGWEDRCGEVARKFIHTLERDVPVFFFVNTGSEDAQLFVTSWS